VASASVTANADGTTSIGKGDVQNALGYANDAAFQADAQAGKITFSLESDQSKTNYVGIKCAPISDSGALDESQVHVLPGVEIGSSITPKTPNVIALKNNQGKVTGYTQTGVTTGAMVSGTYNYGLATRSCRTGEHFAGWVDAGHVFEYVTVTGSPVLKVSNGLKTAELPVTPVV
jgi:hypothetical protein